MAAAPARTLATGGTEVGVGGAALAEVGGLGSGCPTWGGGIGQRWVQEQGGE